MGIGRVRRVALAVLGASLVLAISWSARAGGKPKSLSDFLPPRLGDAEANPPAIMGPDRVVRSYVVKDDAAAPHYVAITLVIGPDQGELAQALAVKEVGETGTAWDGGTIERLRVDGRFVQRTCGPPHTACRVEVLLAKRMLLVHLDIQRSTDQDEPLRWLKLLDLKGMEAFARKEGAAIAAAHRRSEEKDVQERLGELVSRPTAQGGLSSKRIVILPESVLPAPSPRPPTPPTARVEKLAPAQIDKALAARAAGPRYCYEKEISRNPALHGGEIVASFSIAPDGSVADAKVDSTTVGDVHVEGCVLRLLRGVSFPPARVPTQARHTFTFAAPDAGAAGR